MTPFRLLYRAEGGRHVGTGHVLRAARLIAAIRSLVPTEVVLALSGDRDCAALAEGLRDSIRWVEGEPPADGKPVFRPDSLQCVAEDRPFDAIVVDMLDTPQGALSWLQSNDAAIVTMDDRGEGRSDADAIVNVLVREPLASRLPEGTDLFEGPAYATLDSAYTEPAPLRRIADHASRLLVTLGGADAAGLVLTVAKALLGVRDIGHIDFVCGAASPHRAALQSQITGAPWQAGVHGQVPNLRGLLLEADLAVVAGGLTMHEACCVGTPAVAVCQPIDHQVELAEWLEVQGAMRSAGDGTKCGADRIAQLVCEVAGDASSRRAMSEAGRALVDGRGTDRTARAILDIAARKRSRSGS